MAYELHKNAIISNNVNFFCLACDSFLKTKQEAYSHVESPKHCEKLGLVPYAEKYKGHCIRKLKSGYYCAFCNVLSPTAMKVARHILQDDHRQNRGFILLKPSDGDIIAYDTVVIKENVWHGLKENTCSVCDAEFEDENHHSEEITHVLNLMQKSLKFGTNDAIYRQVDETTIHCLTCDKVMSSKIVNNHFDDAEHIKLYENCKTKENDINTAPKTESVANNHSEKIFNKSVPINENKPKKDTVINILRDLETYKLNNFEINFETGTAFCRKCWVVVKFTQDDIDNHIKEHSINKNSKPTKYPSHDNKEKYSVGRNVDTECPNEEGDTEGNTKTSSDTNVDSSSAARGSLSKEETNVSSQSKETRPGNSKASFVAASTSQNNVKKAGMGDSKSNANEVIQMAKDNHITYNAQHANAFCRICQVRLPSTLISMKEHVKGATHKKNTAKLDELQKQENAPIRLKKQKMNIFLHTIQTLENIFQCDVVINNDIFISDLSFFLIADVNNSNILKCHICKMNIIYVPIFYKKAIDSHFRLHTLEFQNMQVVRNVPSEFIREIREGEFHCGICNIVATGWNEMRSHLESSDHKKEKDSSLIRLKIFKNI